MEFVVVVLSIMVAYTIVSLLPELVEWLRDRYDPGDDIPTERW